MNRMVTGLATGLLTATAVVPMSGVLAAGQRVAPQASIPFVNLGGVYNWQADGTQGLWVQDSHKRWYYASLLGPCFGLDFATTLGFDVDSLGTLDRFGAVIVPGWGRCNFSSLAVSNAPPAKLKTTRSTAAAQG
jgi:hypothetical protein